MTDPEFLPASQAIAEADMEVGENMRGHMVRLFGADKADELLVEMEEVTQDVFGCLGDRPVSRRTCVLLLGAISGVIHDGLRAGL